MEHKSKHVMDGGARAGGMIYYYSSWGKKIHSRSTRLMVRIMCWCMRRCGVRGYVEVEEGSGREGCDDGV